MSDRISADEARRLRDFGDRDTEHIASFLTHSGAPTMADQVRQRWADVEWLRAAAQVLRERHLGFGQHRELAPKVCDVCAFFAVIDKQRAAVLSDEGDTSG